MSEPFRSRFVVNGLSAEGMLRIAETLEQSVKARILRGVDAADLPADGLSKAYAKAKIRSGQKPIRDWNLTGRTLAALQVTGVSDREAAIWFNDQVAAQRAAIQNARDVQFGISPSDSVALDVAIANELIDAIGVKAA
jgi:hypothetical protein